MQVLSIHSMLHTVGIIVKIKYVIIKRGQDIHKWKSDPDNTCSSELVWDDEKSRNLDNIRIKYDM